MIGPTAFFLLLILISTNTFISFCVASISFCVASISTSESSRDDNCTTYISNSASGPALDIAMSPKRRADWAAPEGSAADVLVSAAIKAAFKAKLRSGGWNYDGLDPDMLKIEMLKLK